MLKGKVNVSEVDQDLLFHGCLDGWEGYEIFGWAAQIESTKNRLHQPNTYSKKHIKIGVFAGNTLITQGTANIYRIDLFAAGIGNGDHAFSISLTEEMLSVAALEGGELRLIVLDGTPADLGRLLLSETILKDTSVETSQTSNCQVVDASEGDLASHFKAPKKVKINIHPLYKLLEPEFEALRDLSQVASKNPPSFSRPPLTAAPKMFSQKDYVEGGNLPGVMFAYGEYVRHRLRTDKSFPTNEASTEVDHFLNWYIAGYGPLRKGWRVPLSADAIKYLNEPIHIGGQRQSLSRVTWSFLMGVPPILHTMDFQNPEWLNWAVYWWSIDQTKALHCEDVLVPDSYVDLLNEIPPQWSGHAWPLSQFMIRIISQTEILSQFDLSSEPARQEVFLVLLTMSVRRPDYLRYLPVDWVRKLMEVNEEGQTPLSLFLARVEPTFDWPVLDRGLLSGIFRLLAFDLTTRRFLTCSEEGHRFEAAFLPTIESASKVEIQVIGPFEKASGLGQATRLSTAALRNAGYEVNTVDFGLDNPAPEGFSKTGQLSNWQHAKVNLIHLNAESIPLVYAYAPDIFSEAYNIGYFYWELNTPAACHFLAIDLLDEIWVSTEYGIQIYKPDNPKPVTNVGMCFEDLPHLDRIESRNFICDRFEFEGSEFIFLVAFDSFSFIQRKNPIGTLKAFLEAFNGLKDVRLVIKTQNRKKVTDPVQQAIWAEVDLMIAGDTRIRILDETLQYEDLLRLKKGSDCYVSLHKSEGWGFGMIEAMNLGVPVVATGYSGNMEFCSDETAWLVDYEEVNLEPEDYIFVREGQKWAEPDVSNAARQMFLVYQDNLAREKKVAAARAFVHENFSEHAIGLRYKARLKEILRGGVNA